MGLAFAVYSRYYLGGNWSGKIEIKKDHSLLMKGPYDITRHPIYTGLLFGILGTVLIYNQPKGLLALFLVFCAFLFKINKEEKFLLKQFPEYGNYMKKVKRIIPFVY
jgi:protein-S-isoprenylcysteine O-methyltransferase